MQSPSQAKPGEPAFEVIDDLVPAGLFTEACKVCKGKGWYFGHGSHEVDAIPFWKMDLDGEPAFDAIWSQIRERCEAIAGAPLRVIRQYANGHTFGLGGKPHLDDNRPGSYTLLYYPMEEWRDGWDGETVFFDDAGEIASSVRPRPNRAVFFDSRILHAGRAPSRSCPALRVSVAFKLEAVAAVAAVAETPAAEIRTEELSRDGAQRIYDVRVASNVVEARKLQHLVHLGETVRLPGFRPGKIPATVLEARYGAKARETAIGRLAAEAADQLVAKGSLASKVEVVAGAGSGELQVRLTTTHLPDLPPVDFAELELERLTSNDPDAVVALREHLQEQVLDYLNSVYDFPLAPVLVDREFESIWSSAAAQIEAESTSRAAREEITAELREIAERRVRLGAVVAEMARRYEIRLTEDELTKHRAPAETMAQALSRLTEGRVMDYFVARAKVTEREATDEDLRDLR